MTTPPTHHTGESVGVTACRLNNEFHRLADGLHNLGFEALSLDADTPEQGIVNNSLTIIAKLSALAGLKPAGGWQIEAQHLRPGMVIDFGPFSTWLGAEPAHLHLLNITAAEDPDMVVLHGQHGFMSRPIAADFPFEVWTAQRAALEDQLVGVEQDRLGVAADPTRRCCRP